jgi:spermidine/putrescine transport system permease protein
MKLERGLTWFLRAWVGVVFVFVFTPIIFSLIFSFNSQRFPTIPLGEFSTQWYETILADRDVWQAAWTSIVVAVSTSVLATFLGFCTAYSDYRYNFRFKGRTSRSSCCRRPFR